MTIDINLDKEKLHLEGFEAAPTKLGELLTNGLPREARQWYRLASKALKRFFFFGFFVPTLMIAIAAVINIWLPNYLESSVGQKIFLTICVILGPIVALLAIRTLANPTTVATLSIPVARRIIAVVGGLVAFMLALDLALTLLILGAFIHAPLHFVMAGLMVLFFAIAALGLWQSFRSATSTSKTKTFPQDQQLEHTVTQKTDIKKIEVEPRRINFWWIAKCLIFLLMVVALAWVFVTQHWYANTKELAHRYSPFLPTEAQPGPTCSGYDNLNWGNDAGISTIEIELGGSDCWTPKIQLPESWDSHWSLKAQNNQECSFSVWPQGQHPIGPFIAGDNRDSKIITNVMQLQGTDGCQVTFTKGMP